MGSCEICPILANHNGGQDVLVFETKYWRVVLDSDQRFLGKSFVTSLQHIETVNALSSEQWQDLHSVMSRLEISVSRAFQSSHFNWSCLMNNAVVADQSTHVHWHMHPRYVQTVEFSGEIFQDSELFPPKERSAHTVSPDILLRIAQAIG